MVSHILENTKDTLIRKNDAIENFALYIHIFKYIFSHRQCVYKVYISVFNEFRIVTLSGLEFTIHNLNLQPILSAMMPYGIIEIFLFCWHWRVNYFQIKLWCTFRHTIKSWHKTLHAFPVKIFGMSFWFPKIHVEISWENFGKFIGFRISGPTSVSVRVFSGKFEKSFSVDNGLIEVWCTYRMVDGIPNKVVFNFIFFCYPALHAIIS